jgi:hypothetical protein
MPSLLDTLTSSLSSGGFDLNTVVGGLGSATSGISPAGASLDQGALGQIGQNLGAGGFGAIGSSVTGVLGQAAGVKSGFPQPTSLLQPLAGALGTASTFATADPRELLQAFEQAAATGDGAVGMAALAGPLSALSSVRSNAVVAAAFQLLSAALPGGFQLDRTISGFGGPATGIAALVQLVGALMSTEALTREVSATVTTIGGMLDGASADSALAALGSAGSAQLADLIASASPDDPDQVDAIAPAVAAFAASIRGAADTLVAGMAFGEATLVGAGVDCVGTGSRQGTGLR